ncbi:MAG: STAS domain-containing protein [Bryobacterales bacterium]|nr:STAS domain-containing protein [Bryobacterales bacterium]
MKFKLPANLSNLLVIEHTKADGGAAHITLRGKLMLGSDSEQLDDLVARLLGEGVSDFVFDLAGLTHIDSTGIGRFISAFNKIMLVDGGRMRMAGAQGTVRSAFRVTKLDTIFEFVDG